MMQKTEKLLDFDEEESKFEQPRKRAKHMQDILNDD
jgi:hypothetical protein